MPIDKPLFLLLTIHKLNVLKPAIFLSFIFVLFGALLYSCNTTTQDKKLSGNENNSHSGLRLYVLDGGTIENIDVTGFGLKKEDVTFFRFPSPCFLVVHPKGTLMWEAGVVPDSAWKYTGNPVTYKITLPGRQRDITLTKPLKMQLAEIGYSPSDITYFALSHYHYDHTGNANEFAKATWLVRQKDYDAMFGQPTPAITLPATFSALQKSKVHIITKDEYDVFGDGTVIIKSAPGHTPGHQVLFLKLPKTGNIVLSGDLYHYPEEKTLDRVPNTDFNQEQTRATRVIIDTFLKKNNATLWIQHDLTRYNKLKKSPDYYE